MIRFDSVQRAAAVLMLAAALAVPAAGAGVPCRMTILGGMVCAVEEATGRCVFRSRIPASILPKEDQKLLKSGLSIENQAEFTSAAEDFCS